jgi:hypothetical protein
MLHLFKQDGLFESETIATMSKAFEAACRQLDDTGQPELVAQNHCRANYCSGKHR